MALGLRMYVLTKRQGNGEERLEVAKYQAVDTDLLKKGSKDGVAFGNPGMSGEDFTDACASELEQRLNLFGPVRCLRDEVNGNRLGLSKAIAQKALAIFCGRKSGKIDKVKQIMDTSVVLSRMATRSLEQDAWLKAFYDAFDTGTIADFAERYYQAPSEQPVPPGLVIQVEAIDGKNLPLPPETTIVINRQGQVVSRAAGQ